MIGIAEITRMKDGRTALAYKAEDAVDMETRAIMGVTAHGGATGDYGIGSAYPAGGRRGGGRADRNTHGRRGVCGER